MRKIGALYKCDICGKEEFLKRTDHFQLSGGWGCCEEFDESEGWVYKSKIGDICPNCSDKLQNKIVSKYEVSKNQARCYLKNYQDRYVCDSNKTGICSNYKKCAEISDGENHGTRHG